MIKFKGEIIGLLKEVDDLKNKVCNIKDMAARIKPESVELKKELAKHAAKEKQYVMTIMLYLFC